MGSNVRENWRTALPTCAACCKSGSVTGSGTRPSIGPGGTALGGALCREVSTRRPSICCKALPRSDTCPPVGKVTPHPDPPPHGELRCPFCRSGDVEVISLFGSQVMTMQCKCRGCGSYFEASKY